MERARAAAIVAVLAILLAGTVALGAPALVQPDIVPTAAVGWPPSTLVVSEVQTGGASASDEFAEVANVGSASVDLAGMELVYATSTGGTVTRKAAWTTSLLLEPGRHLLVANGSGAFAPVADATYSGGFASTGGAIALRVIGGAPVDALGWGDATNSFVEGAAAPAPAAGSSLERRPGGLAGNTDDTNDNAADFLVQASPNPQNLAAPPIPAPVPTGTPTPLPTGTPTPDPSPEASPTPAATASPTPSPTTPPPPDPTGSPLPDPTPTPDPGPTAEPTQPATPEPAPDATSPPPPDPTTSPDPTPPPTPEPTPGPTPSPTPTPTAAPTPPSTPAPTATPSPAPVVLAIADARALPDGAAAIVVGTLTTDLGALEDGRSGYVQDASGGIAVYLDAALAPAISAGSRVRLEGTLDERYAARTLRVVASLVLDLGPADLPAPVEVRTGEIDERVEGRRATVTGTTSGSSTAFADGLGILVDDGSGAVRVIVGPDALSGATLPSGIFVRVTGPVGQRDSSGTGSAGYRIHATEPGELEILPPPPTPEPTATADPSPTPGPSPSPDPTVSPAPDPSEPPSPVPSVSPSPSPALSIAEARARTAGSVVTVGGTVTAEAGRIGTPALLAIADATGGIVVRLPDRMPAPARGTQVSVAGVLADPYGQLEVRPAPDGFDVLSAGVVPSPLAITAADLGEGTEGRLVTIVGTVASAPRKSTSGDLAADLVDANGIRFRVMTDGSSRLAAADLRAGATYRLVGIVGQRASKKGAPDGYRVWLRDRADIQAASGSEPGASPVPSPGGSTVPVLSIADARRLVDAPATVEGVVTAGAGLLDADGRRIVIQDAAAGIEVLLPANLAAPALGAQIRVEGTVGRALGAPRLRAAAVTSLGTGAAVLPQSLGGAPSEAVEWELVRVAGMIVDVTRLGDRWRADVRVGKANVLVTGLAGAGIASTSLVEGRAVTVIGIARRPYPTAVDRRWAVIPRGPWDLAVGPAAAGAEQTGSSGRGVSATTGVAHSRPAASGGMPLLTIDLGTLSEHVGQTVRVAGLVEARTVHGFTLDDGTALGLVELSGELAAFLDLIEAGDGLGIVGRVEADAGGDPVVVATDPAGLVRLGSLGETVPIAANERPSASVRAPQRVESAGLADPLPSLDGGWLGAMGLVLASASSLFVTAFRRRRAHRRLAEVVARRLAGLRRPSEAA